MAENEDQSLLKATAALKEGGTAILDEAVMDPSQVYGTRTHYSLKKLKDYRYLAKCRTT